MSEHGMGYHKSPEKMVKMMDSMHKMMGGKMMKMNGKMSGGKKVSKKHGKKTY